MHGLKTKKDLGEVKTRSLLGKTTNAREEKEKLSARAKVHHEVDRVSTLKRPVEFDQEGMLQPLHNLPLAQNLLQLAIVRHKVLSHHLHSVEKSSILKVHDITSRTFFRTSKTVENPPLPTTFTSSKSWNSTSFFFPGITLLK